MADLLKLNGIVVPVLDGTAKHEPVELGDDDERAEDESLIVERRAIKERYGLVIAHRTNAHALAWRDLILGKGHYWSFDDTTKGLYSSKGLGPTGSVTGVTLQTTSPYLGAGRVKIALGTNSLSYAMGAQPALTAMVARNVNGFGWNHYIKDSAGNVWTDGVLVGSAPFVTLTAGTGTVKLDGDATFDTFFDELVLLPFLLPSDWPAQMYAWNNSGKQWSPLELLTATGELIDNNVTGGKTVRGHVKNMPLMQGALSGTFGQGVTTLDVELEEA